MKSIFSTILFLLTLGFLSAQSSSTIENQPSYIEKAQAVFYSNIDSAIIYLKEGIPVYREQKDWVSYINCFNGLSSCYHTLGDYTQSISYIKKAQQEAKLKIGKKNLAYVTALNNLAQMYTNKGQYKSALAHFQESLKIKQELGDPEYVINSLYNIGGCYRKKGDLDEAIQYFKNALIQHQEFPEAKPADMALLYNSMAHVYIEKESLDTALVLLQKGVEIIVDPATPRGKALMPMRIDCYFLLADIYFKSGDEKEFLKQIDIAQQFEKEYLNSYSEKGYELLGNWRLQKNDILGAKKEYKKALSSALEHFQSFEHHPNIGKAYNNLGKVCLANGKYAESLAQYHEAINHFSIGHSQSDLLQPPLLDSLISNQDLMEAIQGKANALYHLYLENNDEQYLDAAAKTYELAIEVIDRLRKELRAVGSKEFLSTTAAPLFERAISCLSAQYALAPTPKNLERVFLVSEANKAAILYESINENLAKGNAGIPDSLLQKDAALKTEIAFYNKNIYESRGLQNVPEEKIRNLEQELFSVRRKHQELIATFEDDYPDYYDLKYGSTSLATIEQIKTKLPDDKSAILEYFVGQEQIYLFVISKGSQRLHRIEKNQHLKILVEDLRALLSSPPSAQSAVQQFQLFTKTASELYEQLIPIELMSLKLDRLIIIPDDVLGYIPFEVLLSQPTPTKKVNYGLEHLSYLLKDFRISYDYSSSLWLHEPDKQLRPSKNFLGFAPDFSGSESESRLQLSCNNNELSNLNCTADEVNGIQQLIAGDVFSGNAANKSTFLEIVNQYKVLHFATHSCLDDDNPMLNKIFLSDTYVSNYDLYNLNLSSDLAVLSACDTGNGPLLKGEGVMSLFRGFLHAGCPSSLISFWSVEDCSTKDFMLYYYQHLKSGADKDQAARQAKIEYISQSDRMRSHPFYWASFVQFGSTEPIDFPGSISSILLILASILLSGLLGLLYWRFAKRK